MTRSSIKKVEGMRILAMTESQRRHAGLPATMEEIAIKLEVHPSIPYLWQKELDNARIEFGTDDETVKEERRRIRKRSLRQDQEEVTEKLIAEAKGGNVAASRLLFEKWGMLIKKEEITHKLDGGDIARAILEAEYELGLGGRGENQRVGKVQEKSTLLSDPLPLPSGQSETGESFVSDVASSSETN